MSNLRTFKRGDSRFYVDDSTGATAPGVTSIIDMLPKGFLKFWAAKMSAEFAVENLGAVITLAMKDKNAAVDLIKGASTRFTREAGDFGTQSHNIFEKLARGESPGRMHSEFQLMAGHFKEFLDQAQPEFIHLEQTVWSDTHDFAGSFDAIGTIEGETVILDWKTTRSGIHEEVALQLNAYANADRIILSESGESVALPTIDAGAVLHVRPEGWKLVPVKMDPAIFDMFLHLKHVLEWDRGGKRGVIGNPVMYGGVKETGSERRAN
ncbi:hypothetical protein [Streptomyces sp. NPDC101393]|uniref:hypothetical protein n=1 Tax=Streptomyces sp. NPDC101393 TaxID=3366141 RepID=UPI00382F410D